MFVLLAITFSSRGLSRPLEKILRQIYAKSFAPVFRDIAKQAVSCEASSWVVECPGLVPYGASSQALRPRP